MSSALLSNEYIYPSYVSDTNMVVPTYYISFDTVYNSLSLFCDYVKQNIHVFCCRIIEFIEILKGDSSYVELMLFMLAGTLVMFLIKTNIDYQFEILELRREFNQFKTLMIETETYLLNEHHHLRNNFEKLEKVLNCETNDLHNNEQIIFKKLSQLEKNC